MGVVKRQSILSTGIAYIGILLGYFNLVWLFPLCLTTEEIGLVRFIGNAAMLLVPFVQFGMSNIVTRYFPYFKKEEYHSRFMLFMVLIPAIGFLLVFGILYLGKDWILGHFADKSPLILKYYYLIPPLTFILMYYSVWAAYGRNLMKIVVPNLIRDILIRLAVFGIVLLYFYSIIDFDGFLFFYISSYAAGLLILVTYINSQKKIRFSFSGNIPQSGIARSMYAFGFFSILAGAGGIVVANVDVIMLSAMAGLAPTGVYSIAFNIGTIIELPRKSITQVTVPIIAHAWKNNDRKTLLDLYRKTALNQLLAGMLIFILVWVNTDTLFDIMPNGEAFRDGKYVILFIALGKLIDVGMGNNGELIMNSRYYYFNFISIIILAIVSISLNYLLIPLYYLKGAAIASAISLLIYNLVKYAFIYFKFKMQPFTIQNLYALAIGVLSLLAGMYLPAFAKPISDMLVRSMVVGLVFVLLVIYVNPSPDFKVVILRVIYLPKVWLQKLKTRNPK